MAQPQSKCRGREDQTLASTAAASPRPPALTAPAAVVEPTMTTVADLMDIVLQDILVRLAPADLLRAALACHRWRRAATRALPRAPPLLGYFSHPKDPAPPPPMDSATSDDKTRHPAVFHPLDASSPRLSLGLTPGAAGSLSIADVHLGLVLLLPDSRPKSLLPRVLAVDPASRRRVLLPPPPRDALPDDPWRRDRCVLGVAVLARAHPSRLTFDAVCLTIDGDRPRAWVASVRDGAFDGWRALPRAEGVTVDFDPWWFEGRCVHAAGNVYWHICNSSRMLQLDPRTLELSYMPVPAVLGDRFKKYRVGETPEDGRLCIASIVEDGRLQIWVRGGGEARRSDRGWWLQREVYITKVLDAVPELPEDRMMRYLCTWISDIDYARTGKLFITTWGYGRYSFHLETRKLECLVMEDGKEYGHPIYAYTLAWPPEFLAAPRN